MLMRILYLPIIVFLIFNLFGCSEKRLDYYPAIYEEPQQEELLSPLKYELSNGVTLEAVASFSINAKVLSTLRYRTGDEAKFSPIDIAVGWNLMSEEHILKDLRIVQGARFYSWATNKVELFDEINHIIKSSTNIHIVVIDKKIKKEIFKIKPGQNIYLSGYLVNVKYKNKTWHTSLTRNDSGAGACEILLVQKIIIK